ncbi:MAG: hypothetical protein WAP35_05245 [Solirubrobacterales bacterium]
MDPKEVRSKLDPETCVVCGRRLLQGEVLNWYVAPDSSRRPVCELCVPRAERARWVRVREGEEVVQLRPTRAARGGFIQRVSEFFGAGGEESLDDIGVGGVAGGPRGDQGSRREARSSRRRDRGELPELATAKPAPREVRAIPTGPEAKLDQGLELFNDSQFPRTIAGLSRSLGDPQVAVVNDSESSVEVFVGWDIAWYSYRVDLGDATEPVEQSGRGNDTTELSGTVDEWNSFADEYGHLYLREPAEHGSDDANEAAAKPTSDSPEPTKQAAPEQKEDDGPTVYGGGA